MAATISDRCKSGLLFLSGAMLCNAVPHLASGLQGRRFFTPWARLQTTGISSALENALWGCANLFAGIALAYRFRSEFNWQHLLAVMIGFALAGIALSKVFERRLYKRSPALFPWPAIPYRSLAYRRWYKAADF